jgi:hypothetical protein
MKVILAGAAFATLMVLPLFAEWQAAEGPAYSQLYLEKNQHSKKYLGAAYRGIDGFAWNSDLPTSNANPLKEGLCSIAPEFCPDYHGANGA